LLVAVNILYVKADCKVYIWVAKNCSTNELMPILPRFLKQSASYW